MREGGVAEGSPGHLRMVNGKLTCVPDQRSHDAVPRTMAADTAQRDQRRGVRRMVERTRNSLATQACRGAADEQASRSSSESQLP